MSRHLIPANRRQRHGYSLAWLERRAFMGGMDSRYIVQKQQRRLPAVWQHNVH